MLKFVPGDLKASRNESASPTENLCFTSDDVRSHSVLRGSDEIWRFGQISKLIEKFGKAGRVRLNEDRLKLLCAGDHTGF